MPRDSPTRADWSPLLRDDPHRTAGPALTTALVWQGRRETYRDYNAAVNRVGNALRDTRGHRRDRTLCPESNLHGSNGRQWGIPNGC